MNWFAVHSVFRHGTRKRNVATYEERVIVYRTNSVQQAIERAKKDNAAYLASNRKFSEVGQVSVFAMNADSKELDGAEVWSYLLRGPARSEEFWAARYSKYSMPGE